MWCLLQCRLRILVLILLLGSIVLGQVEAWSGWDGLDEAQRAALLEELNTWADEPLHLRTLTRRQLGELPVSTTTQNVVWDYLQSHPQIRSLDFLDSLMLDSWDYMVLSAAIATDDGGRDQRYRLRMSTRSNQPDERYRQNINLQFNRLSLSAMIQRESEAISFHSYLTGGAVYALPKKYGRLYLGNYRVDSGYGLTFGQSAFVSGSGLNQVYPRLRQRVRIHQSAQMYGYFTGIAWQREWSTLQLLIHLSQNQIPGKIIDGEYVPFPTSSAVNVVYRSARTMGVSLQYMGEEALKVQIHLGSDHLADQWDLPAEVSIAWEHSYLRMAYGAAWWGGDTLSQLFSVRLDGERISSALGFWKIGGQRKLRYRLSEPIIAMQAVNNQGAALGIRYHPGNGVSMEFIAWLRTDVMPIDLQDNAFKRGHESRLTWKNGNVFWRQQWTTGEGSLHKVGIQIHQQQRKEFRLVEFFKLAYQDGMFGGLAGLRWRYRLPGWQVNAGLVRYLAKAYAVRQYAYESGVSSAFSVPLYYGDGVRMYTVIGVLDSFWKLEFQFGQWREFKMEGTTNKLDATLQLSIVF